MADKKLKIGVIGVGNISNEHIQAYLNNPRVELYAFCDIDETAGPHGRKIRCNPHLYR